MLSVIFSNAWPPQSAPITCATSQTSPQRNATRWNGPWSRRLITIKTRTSLGFIRCNKNFETDQTTTLFATSNKVLPSNTSVQKANQAISLKASQPHGSRASWGKHSTDHRRADLGERQGGGTPESPRDAHHWWDENSQFNLHLQAFYHTGKCFFTNLWKVLQMVQNMYFFTLGKGVLLLLCDHNDNDGTMTQISHFASD